MDNLTLHIEYLLLRHDRVVVPGFGVFVNKRCPARYDSMRKAWLPMGREVLFEPGLPAEDGLLTASVARRDQVGEESARERVALAVEDLKRLLAADGEVTIGRLGRLVMEDEKLSLVPLSDPAKVALSLGYTEAPIGRKEPERKFDTARNYYVALNKRLTHVAACVAVILMVTLSVIRPVDADVRPNQASVIPVQELMQCAAPEEEEEAPAPVQAPAEETPAGKYHLVVATFNTAAEAEKFVALHSDSSHKLQVVQTKTKSRVSALNGASRADLLPLLADKEFQSEFPEAWIWEQPV